MAYLPNVQRAATSLFMQLACTSSSKVKGAHLSIASFTGVGWIQTLPMYFSPAYIGHAAWRERGSIANVGAPTPPPLPGCSSMTL